MLGYGYDPGLSEGSVKPPVFLTSTFVFKTAEEGRDFFDIMAGRRARRAKGRRASSIRASTIPISRSSRIASRSTKRRKAGSSSPPAWPRSPRRCSPMCGRARRAAQPAALRRHGDAALEDARAFRRRSVGFTDGLDEGTFARPPNAPWRRGTSRDDLHRDAVQSHEQPRRHRAWCGALRRRSRARQGSRADLVLRQHDARAGVSIAARHGADLSIYSLTKYVGGHSDLIGGAVIGSIERSATHTRHAQRYRHAARSAFLLDAERDRWRLCRCAWTAPPPMRRSWREYLAGHPKVAQVHYPPLLPADHPARKLMERQSSVGRLDLLLRRQGRAGGGLRLPQPACRSSSSRSASAAPSR